MRSRSRIHDVARAAAGLAVGASALLVPAASVGAHAPTHHHAHRAAHRQVHGATANRTDTATPIKHLVVVFQENVPFDHYFGTYPRAANPPGEPSFTPAPRTPTVNGLTQQLLEHNPNSANPQRLDRDQPVVCDSNHGYLAEQKALDRGLMDLFVEETGSRAPGCDQSHGMNYFDGNTVTALWNYAQRFSLNDNSFGTTFGPSHVGAVNLVSGQTHGTIVSQPTAAVVAGTMIGNVEPAFDDCPKSELNVQMTGRNIGNLLNDGDVTWGWFSGGFKPTSREPDGSAVCDEAHTNAHGFRDTDYDSGNEAFQYYRSTSNPHHLAPTSVAAIGHDDRANHQYDLRDFWAAANAHSLPAVSFLKAGGYQQGGGTSSSPLDEQQLIVGLVNGLERLPSWKDTAVVVLYDDSDGGYDHVMPPIVNNSQTVADALTAPGQCGAKAPILGGYQARCGYGGRMPLLVISPWSRVNFVDHTLTDQTSVIRFIEDNWLHGQRIGDGSFDALSGPLTGMFDFGRGPRAPKAFLDPIGGQPLGGRR